MTVLRFQARLTRRGALPEDDVINVFHFDSDQTAAEDADDIAGRILAFYAAIQGVLSDRLTGAIAIKGYEVPDPALPADPTDYAVGPPVHESTGNIVIPASTPLPSEMAMVVSLHTDPAATPIPVLYRRGRIFVGPLSAQTTIYGVNDSDIRVDDAERDIIGNAVVALCTGPDPGDGRLAVYSPTWHRGRGPTGGGAPGGAGPLPALAPHSLDESTNDVVSVSIDNAFDVQRRRGFRATNRTTYPVV
jgi:hypothetical protein